MCVCNNIGVGRLDVPFSCGDMTSHCVWRVAGRGQGGGKAGQGRCNNDILAGSVIESGIQADNGDDKLGNMAPEQYGR